MEQRGGGVSQIVKKCLTPSLNGSKDAHELQNYYMERPMMLTVWTQTNDGDFKEDDADGSHAHSTTKKESNEIKELTEKLHLIEHNLRVHAEIIAKFNTAGGCGERKKQQLQMNETNFGAITPVPATPTQRSPTDFGGISLINPLQTSAQQPMTESVKYRIIADGHNCTLSEPIEIHLAEDDGLNNSADSERLEICLSDEQEMKTTIKAGTVTTMAGEKRAPDDVPLQSAVKNDVNNDVTPSSLTITSSQQSYASTKRRKLSEGPQLITKFNTTNYYGNEVKNILPVQEKHYCSYQLAGGMKANIPEDDIKEKNQLQQQYQAPNSAVITPPTAKPLNAYQTKAMDAMENVMVSIGPNNTRIPAKVYESMSWTSASIATRKLLMAIFHRKTLATHSMTGKPSPAFKYHGKPLKEMLDPLIIQDIIFAVTRKCNVSDKEVRNAITTKCADENKMMKLQMNKTRSLREINKENLT